MEEPDQVTMKEKGPKKVEVGKKLAEYNYRKREEQKSKPKLTLSQYYGAGAIVAIGALDILVCCIYRSKKGDV